MTLPRALINPDGETFDQEIEALEPILGELSNEDRDRYRRLNAEAIARHDSPRILVVAGPGAGKSFLFLERIRHWTSASTTSKVHVASFVRKLVSDLQADAEQKLSDEHQARVTVSTLHSLARSVVERNNGTSAYPLEPSASVIAGKWASVVWRDVFEFHPELDARAVTQHAFERQYQTEDFLADESWQSLHATYASLSTFYNAVGFADMIVRAREAIEENPALILDTHWIIDEYQDFNPAEDHLISALSVGADGVLMAGDDEQALYQQLKCSVPDIIIGYYTGRDFSNAMLPYCSRCSYYICLAASAFIAQGRSTTAIKKIYLPFEVDEQASKLEIVGTAAPATAVEYVERFLRVHRAELEAHRDRMEEGQEKDPFLLILTPDKKLKFLGDSRSALNALVAEWSVLHLGHSDDYWGIVDYITVAVTPTNNFAMRKLLHLRGVGYSRAHELIVEAMTTGARLSELDAPEIQDAITDAGEIVRIVMSSESGTDETVRNLAGVIDIADAERLTRELEANPISVFGPAHDEGEEAIETAGTAKPVELLSLVGAKGLSARHVIVIGCDNVNFAHTTRLTFFVALTRARESLHLLISAKARGGKQIHPFVSELPEGCCHYSIHKRTGDDQLASAAALAAKFVVWNVPPSEPPERPRKRHARELLDADDGVPNCQGMVAPDASGTMIR